MDTIIWVIIMESRLERYKDKRKLAILKFIRLIIIMILAAIFTFLIIRVNETIIELNVLENTDLLILDINNKTLTLFGKTYYIKR